MGGNAEWKSSLFGMVGMFLGGLLMWIVVAPQAAGEASTGEVALLEDLLAVQLRNESLLTEVRDVLPSLAGVSPAAGLEREPLAGRDAALNQVVERLEALDLSLGNLTAALARGSGAGAVMPLAGTSREVNALALAQLQQKTPVDIDLEHMGWTLQQVLDHYGRPSETSVAGGAVEQRWHYEVPGQRSFTFWFIDGRVVRLID